MSDHIDKVRALCQMMISANPGDHFHALGLWFRQVERGEVVAELPYSEGVIGNPENGVVHSGPITTLLDSCCGLAAVAALDELTLCPTMDLRMDYMRPAKPGLPVQAKAEAYRVSSSVIFCRGSAYQEDVREPIAHCVANFIRMDAQVAGVMSARLDPLLASASTALSPPSSPPKQPDSITSLPSLRDAIFVIQQQQQPELLLETLPYAQLLGMRAFYHEGELVLHLPPSKSNIGNPTLPALHGGAIAGFMEMSAAVHLLMTMESVRIPRVVDFSIDYVRAGRLEDTYVSCSVVRQGNKLVNVAITAWQQDRQNPIATARAHFLVD